MRDYIPLLIMIAFGVMCFILGMMAAEPEFIDIEPRSDHIHGSMTVEPSGLCD